MVSPAPLRALSAFEATARHTSMARAAQELGISSSAVSQQIKWLEGYLRRQLFHRSKRPMVLSEAGDRLFHSITGAFADIDNAMQRLGPSSVHGSLAVRASPSLTAKWLIHRIKQWREEFPSVELRLEAVNDFIEFDWSGFDLDIRAGTGNWPGHFCYPLMDETILPLCSPGYLANGPVAAAELTDHSLIYSEKSPFSWAQWFELNGIRPDREPKALRLDRSFLSLEAAKNGLGIALESTFLAADEIASGQLVPAVRGGVPLPIQQHWLVCPHQRLRVPKNRQFIEWLWQALPAQWRTAKPDI